ncbi:MAG: sulfotransferase [Alphaproteobacteria bacterium]|nr:sulfotransferase [Alphaproteobacteria bacterium]
MSIQAAMAALARRDFAAAKVAADAVLAQRAGDAGANQVLGIVALEGGDAALAKTYLSRADASAPGNAPIINLLGVASQRLGELEAARRLFSRAGQRGLIDGWRNLGDLESASGNAPAAAQAYEHALSLNADDAPSHAGLAQASELLHRNELARSHATRALSLDPQSEIAALTIANLALRDGDFAEAERVAFGVARAGRSTTNRALAWGVIGDAKDRSDAPADAFAAFSEANRLLLTRFGSLLSDTHLPYHPDGVGRMADFVAATDFTNWPQAQAPRSPVFLVGFPRSGTTLLEQVLESHSQFVCVEEREHLALAAVDAALDPQRIAELDDAQVAAIQTEYWRRVSAEKGIGNRTVVDKLPLNIIFLPLVRRVFPDAKVLLALRDPRDVILSCYQQRFGMNAAMAQFLQLETAAQYYDKVMSLALLCRERLGLAMLDVRYEQTVASLDGVAHRLCDFLGVAFEEAMLAPDQAARQRNINTPSGRQVVEPIYTRSVQRWRRYEEQLKPALPLLDQWAHKLGYA